MGSDRSLAPNQPQPGSPAPASSDPGKARMKTIWNNDKPLVKLREQLGTDRISHLPTMN